MAKPISNSSK